MWHGLESKELFPVTPPQVHELAAGDPACHWQDDDDHEVYGGVTGYQFHTTPMLPRRQLDRPTATCFRREARDEFGKGPHLSQEIHLRLRE